VIEPAAVRAVRSRDGRFDGLFFYGVTTTGVFCRPSCTAPPAKPDHIRIFPTAAAALGAGYRSCKRCRPGDAPGAPEWRIRHAVARRAVALIAEGATDNDGIASLSEALGYSDRQIRRHLIAEVGATPVALARARRAHAARTLLETTSLPNVEVAFAAGFGSVRQFHETVRAVYDMTPLELRGRSRTATSSEGALTVRLAYREPFAREALLSDLAADAAVGAATFDGGTYRRTVSLTRGGATIALSAEDPGAITCSLALDDLRDLPVAVSRIRRYLDLDADACAIAESLGADPRLAPAVAATPGLRLLGAIEPLETVCVLVAGAAGIPERPADVAALVRALALVDAPAGGPGGATATTGTSEAGQHTVAAERTGATARMGAAARMGESAQRLAESILESDLAAIGWGRRRRSVLRAVVSLVADGSLSLSPAADPDAADAALRSLRCVPWSIATGIRRRVFSDPDVPDADRDGSTADDGWRPWRSYATAYLNRCTAPPARP
jgi:AraC family transcriptional regulator of adaptative response / DNA-3-methyladenine glycosylase II